MSEFKETTIARFDGGIVNDARSPFENLSRMVTGFDVHANPKKLSPLRTSESGDSSASTSQKQAFAIGYWTPTGVYRLFGLGVVSGTGKAEVLMKDISTGGTTDLGDAAWLTPSNNQSGSGLTSFASFVFYKKTGKFYGLRAGTHVWAFTPDGATAFDDTHQALSYTNAAQAIVHSKDDVLYQPYDNKIATCNNGSWSTAALTLPSHLYITSICEKGNMLAIACAPLSGFGQSVVYYWDRNSSLETLTESIDWGYGTVKVLEEVDGILVGISLDGGNSTRFRDRIVFRYAAGSISKVFKTIQADAASGTVLSLAKQKVDAKLYFLMKLTFNGAVREGLWSITALDTGGFSLVHERTSNNDTALGNGVLKGFFIIGDFAFISYVNNSSTYALSKTSDTALYTATSIYESRRFSSGGASLHKSLVGIAVMSEYLPSGAQYVIKYRVDNETSWSAAILTCSTQNSISESTTVGLPKNYHEIEFRIESTGGAEITGFTIKEEITGKRKYD